LTDDWHESNVYDHQSGNVADFVVEIWSLDEGEKCENGDKYKRDEDRE